MFDYGPLIKWGLIVVGLLAVCGAIFYAGMRQKQQEWDAAVMRQAEQTAKDVIAQAENTAKTETKFIETKGKAQVRTKIIEKEVIKYVETPSQKCQLSAEFESTYDRITGLLVESEDSLPTAPNPASPAAEPTGPPVTDVEVLRAHEVLVVQYRDLWLTYRALVEWVKSSYQLSHKEFAP